MKYRRKNFVLQSTRHGNAEHIELTAYGIKVGLWMQTSGFLPEYDRKWCCRRERHDLIRQLRFGIETYIKERMRSWT